MVLLSYLGHAYVWGGARAAEVLPARIAMPWHAVASSLERPPVLSYSSYALHNFFRFDPAREVECGNIALIQNFLGGIDEEWFILIHVDIEKRAAPAMAALHACLDAAEQRDLVLLEAHARAAPVAEATSGQLGLHVLSGDGEPGGEALDDHDERLAVRLAGGQEAKHRPQR